MTVEALIAAAMAARKNAFAPFSYFKVGAALETDDGRIIPGCNVESASYGLTMCAERVALFRAVVEGYRHFKRLAVVTDKPTPCAPCGACRQLLWEFAPEAEVLLANLAGKVMRYSIQELIPHGFDERQLRESGDTE